MIEIKNMLRAIGLLVGALALVSGAAELQAQTEAGSVTDQAAGEAVQPQVIPLWENGAPGFEDRKDEPEQAEDWWVKNIHNPTLTAYIPEKCCGAAVIVCPGGGHRLLVFNAEGCDTAALLNAEGVAVFVLKYRLGREENSPYQIDVHAKADGQRAMRLVRHLAKTKKELGIDPERIGLLGFSAGGETASMVVYGDPAGNEQATDPIDRESCAANFQMLVYPGPLGIPDSLPANVPETFMIVSNDDMGASQVITDLFVQLRDAAVPTELHVLAQGGHGFNLGQRSKLKSVNTWPRLMLDWMHDSHLIDATKRAEYLKQQSQWRERKLKQK